MNWSRSGRRAFLFVVCCVAWPRLAGAQWLTDGSPVSTAAGDQINHASISEGTGGGGAIFTWQDSRGADFDIYVQRVLASGEPAWNGPGGDAAGILVCDAVNAQENPRIASDGAGGAIIVWQDFRNGTSVDIYAQHVLASGALDPAWAANGTLLCNAPQTQNQLRIISDGAGGAIVTWQDFRDGNFDIYVQHVLASGAVDPAWTVNGNPVCIAPNAQENPEIVSDGIGGAIVVWQDFRSGINRDVYAQHITAAGIVDPVWPGDGALLCDAASNQFEPHLVDDGAGGAIVTWHDYRSGHSDIYAQHVLSTGLIDPSWTANGTMLCSAASFQYSPTIATDGAGGAVVAWYDFRNGDSDIYAQRVLASGIVDPNWTANGTLVCGATDNQQSPAIVSDGAGGAIVTWSDVRNGANSDIYALRVLGSGVVDPTWTPDGDQLCGAARNQLSPLIVADGSGGAIVGWYDHRTTGGYDLYAQRVYWGEGVSVPPERGKPLAVQAPYPNPAYSEATIDFDLATPQRVSAGVFDASGRLVRTLAAERELPAGSQNLVWNGLGDDGVPVSAGVYFFRVMAGGVSVARRVAILR